MPLGWLLPNDGYGAGYGQTETLDGNIQNLKELGDYARKNGVEIGLWTQSDLHPKEGISALLQRDIVKEVRDAGVRVLENRCCMGRRRLFIRLERRGRCG